MNAIEKAAHRNGRECADLAVTLAPLPWSEPVYLSILDQMATALVASFPGGPAVFLEHAEEITAAARLGFDRRLEELAVAGGQTGSA